jgi:circadian clock protein KaiB
METNEAQLKDATAAFEQALEASGTERYVLRLYVTGTTLKSVRAIANIKHICQEHLRGRCDLEVIAHADQETAAPFAQTGWRLVRH